MPIKETINQLQTLEGKIDILGKAIRKGDKEAIEYAKEFVEYASPILAKPYANGDPVSEAARLYEKFGLLNESIHEYKKIEKDWAFHRVSELLWKLDKKDEAIVYFKKYMEDSLPCLNAPDDFYINRLLEIANEAKYFGLNEDYKKLILMSINLAVEYNPYWAYDMLREHNVSDGKLIKNIAEKIAEAGEKRGEYKVAAKILREAGLIKRAEFYENLDNI